MGPLSGHRAGIATLTIERDERTPDRLLIRVTTVEDVLLSAPSDERPFSTVEPALAYLRLVDRLVGRAVTQR